MPLHVTWTSLEVQMEEKTDFVLQFTMLKWVVTSSYSHVTMGIKHSVAVDRLSDVKQIFS